jgi:hypothetical protein
MVQSKTTAQIVREALKEDDGMPDCLSIDDENKRWLPLEETRDALHRAMISRSYQKEGNKLVSQNIPCWKVNQIIDDVFGPAKPSGLDVPVKVASPREFKGGAKRATTTKERGR